MNDKINCFILNALDYKDNDLLLQVLTKDHGILSLVSKGAKKINAKNRYMPLCLYEFLFDYKDNKTIYTLKNGKLLHSYFEYEDLELITFKNIIIEVTYKSKEVINSLYYDNLVYLFDRLNKDNMFLLGSLYFSFLLDEYGISPNVDECLVCANKSVIGLSNKLGGFVCQKHVSSNEILEVDRLKKFRYVIKAKMHNYEDLIINFFIDNSDLRLKAYEFYQKI